MEAVLDPAIALAFFLPEASQGANAVRIESLGLGNINDTWRVTLASGRRLVLQRLHPGVFADPGAVLTNMRLVAAHLTQCAPAGVQFLNLVANGAGQDHLIDGAGCCWRLLTHIENSRTVSRLTNPVQARAVGWLLGCFHALTANLDPAHLADPLPDFHITPRYLAHYDWVREQVGEAVQHDTAGEAFCRHRIDELRSTADLLEKVRDRLACGVIHGDPKAANFLFAADADRAISLIDWDTIKPGLLLHDLGDCLRSCCNPLGEEESDPAATVFDRQLFLALMDGYLEQGSHLLGSEDRALIVEAAGLISFELGLRFFTDHLEGDRYFKVTRRGDNLHRALVQFHLHGSIAAQRQVLNQQLARLTAGSLRM